MASTRSFFAILLSLCTAIISEARFAAPPYHNEGGLVRRQDGNAPSPVDAAATPADMGEVIAYITPSPGADAIAITEQGQLVTSFAPEYTLCQLPALAYYSLPPSPSEALPTAVPYGNYSVSLSPDNVTCTTVYKATPTYICNTTLTGLFDKYTVSDCDQEITFSTEFGYVLASPTAEPATAGYNSSLLGSGSMMSEMVPTATASTAADDTITACPSIETLTTYYLADWQELTAGTVPQDIDLKVCRTFDNGTVKCVREQERWEVGLKTEVTSTVTEISLSTTIFGPSQVIVETIVANVTDRVTTFSLSTTMEIEYTTEYTTTSSGSRSGPTPAEIDAPSTTTLPTVFETQTVLRRSSTDEPDSVPPEATSAMAEETALPAIASGEPSPDLEGPLSELDSNVSPTRGADVDSSLSAETAASVPEPTSTLTMLSTLTSTITSTITTTTTSPIDIPERTAEAQAGVNAEAAVSVEGNFGLAAVPDAPTTTSTDWWGMLSGGGGAAAARRRRV